MKFSFPLRGPAPSGGFTLKSKTLKIKQTI